jgi:hypothetical protein
MNFNPPQVQDRENTPFNIPIAAPSPIYPHEMKGSGLDVDVLAAYTIDIDGRARGFQLIEPVLPIFEEPVLQALRQQTYVPATLDKLPVPITVNGRVIFDGGFFRHPKPDPSDPASYQFD